MIYYHLGLLKNADLSQRQNIKCLILINLLLVLQKFVEVYFDIKDFIHYAYLRPKVIHDFKFLQGICLYGPASSRDYYCICSARFNEDCAVS